MPAKIIKPIQIIQGGQWGSEAKGMVAAALCVKDNVDYAVRTGAVNAGHTVYYKGHECKMQQIPVGWVNPNTKLIIGAGAFIFPSILEEEIRLINRLMPEHGDVRDRLWIDERANLHLPSHTEQSTVSDRHHLIGATGKGCSAAIVDKIANRGRGYRQYKQWAYEETDIIKDLFVDTVKLLHHAYDEGDLIQLEGTQGSLLDLHLGPYPYTTHKQTQASQWIAEAGLSPSMEYDIKLVLRTYPIRVAGNSGPMPKEIEWSQLARMINKKLEMTGRSALVDEEAIRLWDFNCAMVMKDWRGMGKVPGGLPDALSDWGPQTRESFPAVVSEFHKTVLGFMGSTPAVGELHKLFEMTTVTKKLRRVAMFDLESAKWSVMVNRPHSIVLTFLNYEFPELWEAEKLLDALSDEPCWNYIKRLENQLGVPVSAVTTGKYTKNYLPL